jgi:hypothetical protein
VSDVFALRPEAVMARSVCGSGRSAKRENDMKRARLKTLHYSDAESGVKHLLVICEPVRPQQVWKVSQKPVLLLNPQLLLSNAHSCHKKVIDPPSIFC